MRICSSSYRHTERHILGFGFQVGEIFLKTSGRLELRRLGTLVLDASRICQDLARSMNFLVWEGSLADMGLSAKEDKSQSRQIFDLCGLDYQNYQRVTGFRFHRSAHVSGKDIFSMLPL